MPVNMVTGLLSSLILYLMCIPRVIKTNMGPHLEDNGTTTCEEFSRFARFNPYSVLHNKWFVFYYWAPVMPTLVYTFKVPTTNHKRQLQNFMDSRVIYPVNWTATVVLMRELNSNDTTLLVQRGDRGQFLMYQVPKWLKKGHTISHLNINFKQTGDNKYLSYMLCTAKMTYVMSRFQDIPGKNKLQDVVARIGFRGRGGKSYLYQGHEWMPIPEADDDFEEELVEHNPYL